MSFNYVFSLLLAEFYFSISKASDTRGQARRTQLVEYNDHLDEAKRSSSRNCYIFE